MAIRLCKIMSILCLCLCVVVLAGCAKNNETYSELRFGKKITITVTKYEVVDSAHLQKVLAGDIKKDVAYFDLWDEEDLEKMIKYMEENDFVIAPGQYTFNQAWRFDDGMLVLNNGEKRKVFSFQKSQ